MRTKKRVIAFALASAMLITAMPASVATVKAAATPALTASKKYLKVGDSSKMYIKNKTKGATYKFTSSNSKIASINSKTGAIKGVAVGKCKVTLKATVNKKTYTSSATIIVKEHAQTIEFAIDDEELTLPVGEDVYTFKTVMTTETGGKCTDYDYFVIPEDTNTAGATIDSSKGIVSVKNPGSFQVIAYASTSWNAMFKKNSYYAKSEPLTVTVPTTLETSMESVNTIKLKSNISLSKYSKDDYVVTSDGTGQVLKVTELELSSDGKEVTLTTSNTFGKGDTYTVSLADQNLLDSFVANYGTINKIVANDNQSIAPDVATPLDYTIYDENGVDITKLYPHTMAGFDFIFEPSSTTLDDYGRITLPTKSSYAFYTIRYTYLDSSNKKQVIESNRGRVTASGSNLKALQSYSISPNTSLDYSDAIHSVAVGESNYKLYCLFENSVGGTLDTSKTTINNLTFTSNNTSVCGIDRTTGLLFPYKEGTAKITISDGIFSTDVTITVGEAKKINSLVASESNITVSNSSGLSNSQSVRFELRDQYGSIYKLPITGSSYPTARIISGNENIVTVNGNTITKTMSTIYTSPSGGVFNLTFAGKNNGSCTVEISYAGKTSLINVAVKQPGVVSTYKPELSNTVLDPNVQGKNSAILKVYAVDSNGIKISTVSEGYYSIVAADGTVIVPNQMITGSSGEVIDATKLKLADGTYRLTFTSGPITESTTFQVKASDAIINIVPQTTTSTTVKTTDDVVTKIFDCFNVYLSGNSSAIPASSLVTGSSPLLSNVKVSFNSYDSRYFDSAVDLAIGGRDFSKNYIGYTASIRVTKISFTYLGQTFTFEPNQDLTLRVQNAS